MINIEECFQDYKLCMKNHCPCMKEEFYLSPQCDFELYCVLCNNTCISDGISFEEMVEEGFEHMKEFHKDKELDQILYVRRVYEFRKVE